MTVTTVNDFKGVFGTKTIFYYVGQDGFHSGGDYASGTGGASSLVLTVQPTDTLSLDQVVLIAGGGGGGGGR